MLFSSSARHKVGLDLLLLASVGANTTLSIAAETFSHKLREMQVELFVISCQYPRSDECMVLQLYVQSLLPHTYGFPHYSNPITG
jgi:hypothetical protein